MLNEAKQGTAFQRNKIIKIIKMTMKIISLFGIDWDGPWKNYQFPIIWTALSNITSPTAM